MRSLRRFACVVVVAPLVAAAATACTGGTGPARARSATSAPRPNRSKVPLPPPVHVRATPQGVTLGNPAFTAIAGARADFGRLGGAVYQIEVPVHWNRRLVLFMHGFEELAPQAHTGPPDIRTYLIAQGYAWGASSFSSTGSIPGRAADETAALWDFFARRYGRPSFTYVTGFSMGGLATQIAAERYADRFDGALAFCGSAGATPGLKAEADFFVAGAFAAGVTQAQFDASTDLHGLVYDRIVPALRDPQAHRRFEDIMIDLSGGPRAFDRQGFEAEEETNWRRAFQLSATQIAPNRDTRYQLGPLSTVTSAEFGRAVIRLPVDRLRLHGFVAGSDLTGRLRMPLLSLHTTGDFQVPIEQARILQRRVDAAGRSGLLVQRVIRDAGHCGFTTAEQTASFTALVRWVEHGAKPDGTNVLVADLRKLDRTFELTPREGLPGATAAPGASDRVVVRGDATLDGAPFDAQFLGAVVRREGLVTPCQVTLPRVQRGRYSIPVFAATEASGCGAPGAEIVLWTFAHGRILYSTRGVAWPGNGATTSFEPSFSSSAPAGAAPVTAQFSGEIFRRDGSELPPGTRVEAYVRGTLCGIASTRGSGNFTGFSLDVVGPDSIAGCTLGATITFRVDGRPVTMTALNTPPGRRDSLNITVP
jgi:pimeloyl-ACP methyl ester carboxylesterase